MRVMTRKSLFRFILPWLLALTNPAGGTTLIKHELQITLNPDEQSIQVTDRIELTDQSGREFLLHDGLKPRSLTPGVTIKRQGSIGGPTPIVAYRLSMPEGQRSFTLEYGGMIAHELTRHRESPGRSRERLSGTISSEGVYLDASVAWYPYFPDTLQAFSMKVSLPQDWLAVSQGKGPGIETLADGVTVNWDEPSPQDDIYLIAGPYQIYRQAAGDAEAQVFLRQPEAALAKRYLTATEHYLTLYQQLIGDYAYPKFAMVENFWESGYGMPSFTLLGPRVLRFPFILHTSYPHEILHNWWGNSVYIDYASGNWAEGLTTYLADHLLDELRGRGVNHRRTVLQRYGDFIREENDFPLTRFRSRHGSASQAVGYGKSLMLFHMLRRHLGDAAFLAGLQLFYRENRFKVAGYRDLQKAFEQAGNRPLEDIFQPWTNRTGAPSLAARDISLEESQEGYRIQGVLHQTQPEPPFPIDVALVIHREDEEPLKVNVKMRERKTPFSVELKSKPLQLDIDPWFDLFRHLYPEETPPTLSNLFGSERILILLPAEASKASLQAYRRLANHWGEGYREAEIRLDSEVKQLPGDRPVWLLGWENRHLAAFLTGLEHYPFERQSEALRINQNHYRLGDHSFALTRRNPANGQTQAWLAGVSPESIAGLARKLPHYGKYSYLAFTGRGPKNVLKGQWPVTASPLRIPLTPRTALLQAPQPAPLIPPSTGLPGVLRK